MPEKSPSESAALSVCTEPIVLSNLEKLVGVVEEALEQPIEFNSNLLGVGEQTSHPIYPVPSSGVVSAVPLRGNPMQLLRVDPASFASPEVKWDLTSFSGAGTDGVSEFEELLQAYLVSLREKQKTGNQVKVSVCNGIIHFSRLLGMTWSPFVTMSGNATRKPSKQGS